jgi:hypothetical protein
MVKRVRFEIAQTREQFSIPRVTKVQARQVCDVIARGEMVLISIDEANSLITKTFKSMDARDTTTTTTTTVA